MNALKASEHTTRRRFLNSLFWSVYFFLPIRQSYVNALETDRDVVEDSLDRLASRQNEDGSFGVSSELFGRDPAVAALSGLAFLAAGSFPGRGRYGDVLSKIVSYVGNCSFKVNKQQTGFVGVDRSYEQIVDDYLSDNNLEAKQIDGLIANLRENGRKPLYGHGYSTLFLAEIFGTTNDQSIRDKIKNAIDLIVRTQNAEGGWRYTPSAVPLADISVTVCQLSALRSCENAGIYVPSNTVTRAVAYIRSLQNSDGGFRYMTAEGPSGYGRTAAAIHALQSSGTDYEVEIQRGFEYLENVYPTVADTIQRNNMIEYWTYAQFYATLAYWRAATTNSTQTKWNDFSRRVRQDLLARRSEDGLWNSNISTEVETSFALCALLTFRENSPLFLR